MISDPALEQRRLVGQATYVAVLVACVLIIVKLVAWFWTDALSLQATLIDSILDAAASMLNFVAVRQAYRPPDKEHRFGHGKIEALAGLGQSVFIGASSIWLMLEAFQRFLHPQKVEASFLGIGVMVFAIILTSALVIYQNYVIKKTQSPAIMADSVHYRSDILINVGVIFVLMGDDWLNTALFDSLFGLGIALYILYTAWTIAKNSFHILIDGELSDEIRAKIIEIALDHPQVLGCHDVKTRSSGSQNFIQMHLEMDENLSLKTAHEISYEVMERLYQAFPNADVIIHEDPRKPKPLKDS